MVSDAPPFWWKKPGLAAWLLYPVSCAYAAAARRGLATAPRERLDIPVLCVGNLTVGGSGKTPVAIALAREALRMGHQPGILSRGHGGSVGKPHIVDPHHDVARHVGDEPLILAREAPVVVTPDRAAGARLLAAEGCDFIIMDDGFQSARIHIDYALLVVDARRGIGNGHVVPGGPLRATMVDQMRYADGVLKLGEGEGADTALRQAARAGRAFFEAHVVPRRCPPIEGRRCLAYAGIGDPDKFFDTVAALGGDVVAERRFGDHRFYSEFDAQDLLQTADAQGLELVTTAKDAARLDHGTGALDTLRQRSHVVEIDVAFDVVNAPGAIIAQTLESWRRRRLRQD